MLSPAVEKNHLGAFLHWYAPCFTSGNSALVAYDRAVHLEAVSVPRSSKAQPGLRLLLKEMDYGGWNLQWLKSKSCYMWERWSNFYWEWVSLDNCHLIRRGKIRGWGFLSGASGKEPTCQCRRQKRHRLEPWIGKIPWRREWQPHSSILAWRIPWIEETGGLQSTGLQRVRHDWSD